jgi:hypothetical protein
VAAFPKDPASLEVVRHLGGSTGAELVRDPETGALYVRKRGSSPEHLRSECATDAAYRALGVKVPEFQLYETGTGPVKLSAYIPDTTSLTEVMRSGSKSEIRAVLRKLQADFPADALLANWDVVGLDFDNILIDRDKNVWRIDNGSGLLFRAQGGLKPAGALNEWPTELWSMRDPGRNESAARAFGDADWSAMAARMRHYGSTRRTEAFLNAMPEELRGTMARRMEVMYDIGRQTARMEKDQWNAPYLDEFWKHSVHLRQEKLLDYLPKKMSIYDDYKLKDEKGDPWDDLRGERAITGAIKDYINRNGGDYQLVKYWMSAQGGDSWSPNSQALKYWIAQQRGLPMDAYYWQKGPDSARFHYQDVLGYAAGGTPDEKQKAWDTTWTAWHAFNYETVRNVQFPGNRISKGIVELMRTESKTVMDAYGIREKEVATMTRGACESASIFQGISVGGGEMTLQEVPHHRIMGMYFYSPDKGSWQSPFYGDSENEFLFVPEGLPFYYFGDIYRISSLDRDTFWREWRRKQWLG